MTRIALAAAALIAMVAPLEARQEPRGVEPAAGSATTAAAVPVGTGTIAARIAPTPAAAQLIAAAAALDAGPAAPRAPAVLQARRGQGAAFAVVGGVLFVGGLVAGGNAGAILILGGAGIGAYGLYLLLV